MRKAIVILLALILTLPSAGSGDFQKDVERTIGKEVAAEIESTYGVVDDPLLTGWVNRLGQRLASVSGRTDIKYQFKVLDDDEVNAVAAPGGFIYVNRGTLNFVKSEDELAAVMGHEVGHVAGRHSMKQINAQLLGSLVLAGFQALHANTLSTIGGMAGGLAMLKFGRDEENDADRRGLRNAVATGYSGDAMLDFFRRLDATEKEHPSKLEIYFLNHPPTPERIRRISKEPGTAHSATNLLALAEGLESRSLYRRAAEVYRQALQGDPDNRELKQKLAACSAHLPRNAATAKLPADAKAEALRQLDGFGAELTETERQVNEDWRGMIGAQKSTNDELQAAAQSLSNASQYITRRDSPQYRELVRMARGFDRAVRVGANLRAARDWSQDTISDISLLARQVREGVEKGDAAAAGQAQWLNSTGRTILTDVAAGTKQARSRAGDAKDGARALRNAADSLYASYRTPFGYSSGQFDILGLQVGSAQDSLNSAVGASRRALGLVARARAWALIARINNATRGVKADDPAVAGVIAHYLGVEPQAVIAARSQRDFGSAALSLAEDQIEAASKNKNRADAHQALTASFAEHKKPTDREGERWQNISVLFNLMTCDIERETEKG